MRTVARMVLLWLTTAFRAAPLAASAMFVTTILGTVVAPLMMLGMSLAIAAATSGTSLWPGVLLTGGCLVVGAIAASLGDALSDTVDELVWRYVHDDLLRLAAQIPSIAHHEHPAMADRIALLERDAHRLGGVWRLLSIIGSVSGTVTVCAVLASAHPALCLLLVLALIPATTSAVGLYRRHMLWHTNERFRRLGTKLADVLNDARQGVEVRSFGMSQSLLWVVAESMDRRARPWVATARRYGWLTAAGWLVFTAGYAAALLWMFARGRAGLADIGDLTLVLLLVSQVTTTAQAITSNASMVLDGLDTFDRYLWLRDYAAANTWGDSTEAPPDRLSTGIRFDGVSFAYPSAQADDTVARPSLHEIDLLLPAGSTVAFVGENGAGKSTLVKLLARLYDPSEGVIMVDDVPLSAIDPVQWRARLSAGFQDFASLEFLAADSIGVGDLASRTDRAVVDTAVGTGQADVVITSLADGLDTQLGTRFAGGVTLSGGQWQRIALARAFMRTSGGTTKPPLLMLLDEPTAALDPEAEQAIYQRYGSTARELARQTGAVTILVSHRFSTVRMADLIVVVDDGRIVELGTHTELLAAGGRYAELFRLQARAYR